jgi:hypothetical protein
LQKGSWESQPDPNLAVGFLMASSYWSKPMRFAGTLLTVTGTDHEESH